MDIQSTISRRLKEIYPDLQSPFEFSHTAGGSINNSLKIRSAKRDFFCKTNSATKFPQLFQKEKQGLDLISLHHIILTPAIIDCFEENGSQYLLMEWIQTGEKTNSFWKIFGEQLARLHQVNDMSFGWQHDNYMGSVKQENTACFGWIDFFINKRLRPLVAACSTKALLPSKSRNAFEQLYKKLEVLFDEKEKPSLLHGDLWNGNFMCNENHLPVLIDPAVYFGHRSMDLGMTTLFGGFSRSFYEAYHFHFPFPLNYKEQWQVCNLYPLLIHLLLFGSGYLPQIDSVLNQFR